MRREVLIVESAELDLYEIHFYVESYDSTARADELLEGLERAVASLAEISERGHIPPELLRIGIRDYREIHFKPYRIVYDIRGDAVVVHCVLDGRRDMQSLLQDRLLR